ncbi:restriction endonuclease subunit S [Arachnia propionica]
MSHIDKLIADLCPNGIEFIKIEDLFDLKNGYTPSKSNSSFWENGTVPWFRMEDIRTNGRVLSHSLQQISESGVKGGKLFPPNSLLVATSATIGEHALITVPHLSNQRFTSLSVKHKWTDQVDIKFLYHYAFILDKWCRANTTTSSFASVDMTGFKNFPIPIPPLEVQREIVRVLDKFTQLEAELEAELEARRRQYEHYRAILLSFGNKIEWTTLGNIATIGTGSHDTKNAVPDGEYVFYARGREPLRLDSFDFDENAIITAGDGVGVGKVFHFATGKYALHQRAYRIAPHKGVDTRYVYHYLVSDFSNYLKQTSVHASVTSLRRPMFIKYPIPLPPLEEQRRIVSVLDKFDSLVSDLTIGLPAELAARRKQYEYYRDRLLTFEEKR